MAGQTMMNPAMGLMMNPGVGMLGTGLVAPPGAMPYIGSGRSDMEPGAKMLRLDETGTEFVSSVFR